MSLLSKYGIFDDDENDDDDLFPRMEEKSIFVLSYRSSTCKPPVDAYMLQYNGKLRSKTKFSFKNADGSKLICTFRFVTRKPWMVNKWHFEEDVEKPSQWLKLVLTHDSQGHKVVKGIYTVYPPDAQEDLEIALFVKGSRGVFVQHKSKPKIIATNFDDWDF
jgi:hypothetical protein